MNITLILVDDHHLIREGLRALLTSQPEFSIIGEASDGRVAVSLCKEKKPDVVIMDVSMPELNGIEATRQIIHELNTVKVIALSMYSDRRFVEGMIEAGISGYLLKSCIGEELFAAIHKVVKGEMYLSSQLSGAVMTGYSRFLRKSTSIKELQLTNREIEILQLIAEGKDTKNIAETLFISSKTVETHRRNIMKKLDAQSIADLVRYALQKGIISL